MLFVGILQLPVSVTLLCGCTRDVFKYVIPVLITSLYYDWLLKDTENSIQVLGMERKRILYRLHRECQNHVYRPAEMKSVRIL